jgi:PRTRC genetic system protein E
MFQTLENLIAASGELKMTMIPAANGVIKVAVIPSRKANSDAALAQPLFLTGTAAELDTGFAAAIQTFSRARSSLVEQVEATTTVLAAAEKKQADKATKKLSTKPASSAASASATDDSDADNEADNENDSGESNDADNATGDASSPAPAAADAGTDLSSLF